MKIRLIALFLVVVYIMSSKGNAHITNMLVNTEAEYATVTTKIQKDKAALWLSVEVHDK